MRSSKRDSADLAKLALATRKFIVSATGYDGRGMDHLAAFLAEVRAALGMDIAFLSRFTDGQRVFKVVSASSEEPFGVVVGASDPLVDSYCKLIVEKRLPTAIPDTSVVAAAAALPITERLNIRSYLSVPVVLENGDVFGTLCCFSHVARSDLSSSTADALQVAADAIATAIGRDPGLRDGLS